MISLNFDIFFRIFSDLVAELKSINFKFVVRAKPELRASAKYTAKLQSKHACNFTGLQTSTQFDQETVTKGSLPDS